MFTEVEGNEEQIEGQAPKSSELDDRYYKIDELLAMNSAELEELWQNVPTDRQSFYEKAYDEAMSSLGQGDIPDEAAMSLTEQMINYYSSGQVPIVTGNRWVQVPGWIRDAVETGKDFDQANVEADGEKRGGGDDDDGLPLPVRIGLGVGILAAICFILWLVFGNRGPSDPVVTAEGTEIRPRDATETALVEEQLTADAALTPTVTETPIVFDDLDAVIGQGDFENYFPILLEVQPQDVSSRVYVVQQKPIDVAAWDYDERNPDIATWISGLLVKPVLGIPFTPDNKSLLDDVQAGDELLLHMSTGNILKFVVEEKDRVVRQDTTLFQQNEPGIVLVMLGETGANDRLVIIGSYPPEQELQQEGSEGVVAPTTVSQIGDTESLPGDLGTITVIDSYTSLGDEEGAELPDDLAYLLVDIEVQAPEDASLDMSAVTFNLLDTLGQRYSTVTLNAVFTNYVPVAGQVLEPGETLTGTIAYLVPRTISASSTLNISTSQSLPPLAYVLEYVRPVDLVPPALEVLVENVQLVSIEGAQDQLVITYSVFNPSDRVPAFLTSNDVFIIYTDQVPADNNFPTGPRITPLTTETDTVEGPTATPAPTSTTVAGEPTSTPAPEATAFVASSIDDGIPPGEEVSIISAFNWDGSQFVGIQIAGYQYFAQLQ